MLRSFLPIVIFLTHSFCYLNAQSSFKDSLLRSNPVSKDSTYSWEEKLKIHQTYLNQARTGNETQKQVFGYIYLFSDYVIAANFEDATRQLLEAEKLVNSTGNKKWVGEIISRKAVISIRLEKMAEAATQFQEAAWLFEQAKDTLRMAECIEQTGAAYSHSGDFKQALKQYEKALPLLEKYGNERQLRVALGNFGNVLLLQNQPAQAIPFFERALSIHRKLGDKEKEAQELGDLANAFARLKNYDKAFEHYRQSAEIAKEQNLPSVLYVTYSDWAETCAESGDYKTAFSHLKKYHQLRDSIVGTETQEKIEGLKIQYETHEKELAFQKSQAALSSTKETLKYWSALTVLAVISLALAIILALKLKKGRTRSEILHATQKRMLEQDLKLKALEQATLQDRIISKQKDLTDLGLDISRKNEFVETLLLKIDSLNTQSDQSTDKVLRNLQNFILNHSRLNKEMAVFQEKIDEVSHDFFQKLEARFGALSPSEKELCGLLRLNLSNKGIADIKSISPNSAKIARYRLRKRLGLDADQDIVALLQNL